MNQRTCTSCGCTKSLDEFDIDKNATLGRRSHCKPCRSAKMKAWYAANQERQRDRQRARYEKWPERIQQQDRERYERHRERRIELALLAFDRRRSRLAMVDHDETVTRANLRKQYGDSCFYCQTLMTFSRTSRGSGLRPKNLATLEHLDPISRGGSHTWDNVVLACWGCNIKKNSAPLDQWMSSTEVDDVTELATDPGGHPSTGRHGHTPSQGCLYL